MSMHRMMPGLALALIVAACGGEQAAETGEMPMDGMAGMPMEGMSSVRPAVSFVQPADGATVGPNVTIELSVSNFRVAPAGTMEAGTGHHHLFVDVDVTPTSQAIPAGVPGIVHLGMAQTSYVLEGLAPGRHRLIAVVADGLHVPVFPIMADTINITVGP